VDQKSSEIRRILKQALVKAFGGSCCCCGYDKNLSSLTFHHLDPDSKSFTFGKTRITEGIHDRFAEEAAKCVLVCNNCHSEITAGDLSVPCNPVRFRRAVFFKELKKLGF